ncbi:15127_t:CDS:2, partial [Cetraspora pellucida]
LAQRLFSILLSQANCKRNFSTLKWFIGDKRTHFGIEKLEGIAKIRFYHMANIQNKLTYFDTELTEFELCEMIKIATINDYITNEKELNKNNENFEFFTEIADSNIEDNIDTNFNSEELVDIVLSVEL